MSTTIGEMLDEMTIEQIVNHPNFSSLKIEKGFGTSPDYFEIVFESDKRNSPKDTWLTFYNHEVHSKFYRCYKLKTT